MSKRYIVSTKPADLDGNELRGLLARFDTREAARDYAKLARPCWVIDTEGMGDDYYGADGFSGEQL